MPAIRLDREPPTPFGQFLYRLMLRRRMGIRRFAKDLGIDRDTLMRIYDRNDVKPSLDVVLTISCSIGMDFSALCALARPDMAVELARQCGAVGSSPDVLDALREVDQMRFDVATAVESLLRHKTAGPLVIGDASWIQQTTRELRTEIANLQSALTALDQLVKATPEALPIQKQARTTSAESAKRIQHLLDWLDTRGQADAE